MKFNTSRLLFFDVETVPQHKEYNDQEGQLKKLWDSYYNLFSKRITDDSKLVGLVPESDEDKQEVYKQTAAFFPEFGKVACVSLGFVTDKGEIKLESHYGVDEVEILTKVREVFDKVNGMNYSLCGQNIKGFDIPFLGKRYVINGLNPPKAFPTHDMKPWELNVVDTKDVWGFGSNRGIGSLDLITSVLGVSSPKDGDIHGDNVYHSYWIDKNYEGIKTYCEKDVKALVDIITKLNSLK